MNSEITFILVKAPFPMVSLYFCEMPCKKNTETVAEQRRESQHHRAVTASLEILGRPKGQT